MRIEIKTFGIELRYRSLLLIPAGEDGIHCPSCDVVPVSEAQAILPFFRVSIAVSNCAALAALVGQLGSHWRGNDYWRIAHPFIFAEVVGQLGLKRGLAAQGASVKVWPAILRRRVRPSPRLWSAWSRSNNLRSVRKALLQLRIHRRGVGFGEKTVGYALPAMHTILEAIAEFYPVAMMTSWPPSYKTILRIFSVHGCVGESAWYQ